MENSYKYFENHGCFAYPCHKDLESKTGTHNCLFCYCPLYCKDCKSLGGNPTLVKGIKDCSLCEFNHDVSRYDEFIDQVIKAYGFSKVSCVTKS